MLCLGLQRWMIDRVVVTRLNGENEGRHGLCRKRLNNTADLVIGEQVAVAVTVVLWPPDHHPVLVDMRQVKAVARQQVPCSVQGTASGDGIGNTPPLQSQQGLTGMS